MKEASGDIWAAGAQCICIPTNQMVKTNGELVMGAGVAKAAAQKYPGLAAEWGAAISAGNKGCCLYNAGNGLWLMNFPTKNDWRSPGDPKLLLLSAQQAQALADQHPEWTEIVLPRVGCGYGSLQWSVVKPIIAAVLDDRFVTLTMEGD